MKTKMIKSFSLVLTLIMLLSAIPFTASAAEPIALKASNVTVWPTAVGEMYVGQVIGEHITLVGGEVQYNGVIVPGHFEHIDPEYAITSSDGADDAWAADIKFVPDDTTTYKGFSKSYSKTTFPVYKATPVFVDENDTVPVATEVDAGAALNTSILSGAKMTNPYNADEPGINSKGKWVWNDSNSHNVIVNESGYHLARFFCSGYENVKVWVLVRVKGDTSEVKIATSIEELPTVEGEYYVGDKWADVKLVGGKAVDMDGNPVSGTFNFDTTNEKLGVAGTLGTRVKFTPDDSRYSTAKSGQDVNFTVNKAPVKFVDSEGKEIVPEITIEYTNAKIGQYNFRYYLKPYTNLTDSDGVSFNFAGLEGENDYITVGTKKYKINASAQNQNYEKSVLEFILTVTPKPLDITVSYVNNQIVISRTTTDRINGSFEIYVDGVKLADSVKIEGAQSSAKYGWTPKTSGTHTVKAVYVPAENDTVSIEPAETQVQMNLTRALGLPEGSGYIAKVNGSSNFTSVACGDTVSLSCTFEDFECWIITGADGKTADLGTVMTEKTVTDANGGVTFVTEEGDLSCANIIFAMPDEDITVTYKLKEADPGNDPVDGEKDFFAQVKAFFENLFNGESDNTVLDWLKRIFNIIVEFFTGFFNGLVC